MGNYKFRLSDMIPNAWFYKLREMGGSRGRSSNNQAAFDSRKKRHPPPPSSSATMTPPLKQKQPPPPPPQSRSRKSYYFSRELEANDGFCINSPSKTKLDCNTCYFPELPPRKSSKQQKAGKRRTSSRSTTKLGGSSVGCSCRTTAESICTKSDSPPEFSTSPSETSLDPELRTDKIPASESFDHDIIIDVSTKYEDNVVGAFDSLSEVELPPIITKHAKFNDHKKKETKQRTTISPTKKFAANSPGVRLRIHSPKIANRKINQASGRKSLSSRRSLSDSLAIMKSSYDPQRDFRESMVEMIVENNIRASKDLEDLLACYLSLNADEYHDLIIKVFKQIWFDLTEAV